MKTNKRRLELLLKAVKQPGYKTYFDDRDNTYVVEVIKNKGNYQVVYNEDGSFNRYHYFGEDRFHYEVTDELQAIFDEGLADQLTIPNGRSGRLEKVKFLATHDLFTDFNHDRHEYIIREEYSKRINPSGMGFKVSVNHEGDIVNSIYDDTAKADKFIADRVQAISATVEEVKGGD